MIWQTRHTFRYIKEENKELRQFYDETLRLLTWIKKQKTKRKKFAVDSKINKLLIDNEKQRNKTMRVVVTFIESKKNIKKNKSTK